MSAGTPLALAFSPVDALPADELAGYIEWLTEHIREQAVEEASLPVLAASLERIVAEERVQLRARAAALSGIEVWCKEARARAEALRVRQLQRVAVLHKLRARRDALRGPR
jgi:hypothetical protein